MSREHEFDLMKELELVMRRKRPYASYFDFAHDRPGTEMGVVRDWLEATASRNAGKFKTLNHRAPPNDPPDVELLDGKGVRYGIEVTELVDNETIKAHKNGSSSDFKDYSDAYLRGAVATRVEKKSKAVFKGPPCEQKFLIIYSDEPLITADQLTRFPWLNSDVFNEIWFMLPPPVHNAGDEPENPECQIFLIGGFWFNRIVDFLWRWPLTRAGLALLRKLNSD